jgi:hypothetical protein
MEHALERSGSPEPKQLRAFGAIMALAFLVIGVLPLLKGLDARVWALIVCAAFVLAALALPGALARPYAVWMRIGAVLGWINTRIILSVIYFGVLTPVGLLRRAFGQDALSLRLDRGKDTYAAPVEPRDMRHMKHLF